MLIPNATETLRKLIAENRQLLERYDPEKSIEHFDKVRSEYPYHYLPKTIERYWTALEQDFGEEEFDAFQKITMLRLMERFESRAVGKRYSESILERFRISFRRIIQSINDQNFNKYRKNNDIVLKDLAICRQFVFPAGGARVVHPNSGFPRSLLFRGNPYQGLSILGLLIRLWGNKPFYGHHTHLSELEEFNPDDFKRCNLRLADMLELNPEIKGVVCGSWLYDPALEAISPHLSYMREMQQSNGALVFFVGISIDGGALSKSRTRQALYKQGKYTPKSYCVIWPRRSLLDWAHRAALNSNSKDEIDGSI